MSDIGKKDLGMGGGGGNITPQNLFALIDTDGNIIAVIENGKVLFSISNELLEKISTVYKFKGSVQTYADLPTNAEMGDVYDILDTGDNYAWTGTEWDKLSGIVDLSGYYTKTETDDLLNEKVDKTSILAGEPNETSLNTQVPNAKRIFAMMGASISTLKTSAKHIVLAINEIFESVNVNYATNEVLTGDTWGTDKLPIYRKAFSGTTNGYGRFVITDTVSSSTGIIVAACGNLTSPKDYSQIAIGNWDEQNGIGSIFAINGNGLCVVAFTAAAPIQPSNVVGWVKYVKSVPPPAGNN
jgi:hypothetical protein